MKRLLTLALIAGTFALTAWAHASSPPNTTDLYIVTGEGHQVTATWRSTEPSTFHCWLTTSLVRGDSRSTRVEWPERQPMGTGRVRTRIDQPARPRHTSSARLPCTPPHYIDGLSPGTYTLHVRAFGNESGLREAVPAHAGFTLP